MTTEDGKFGVMTREGASSRKNGIVVLSFEDPAHPVQVAEFTETVTGGVHSTFIYRGYVYLTDDATGSMRVIDIRDPYHPSQVARWETPRTEAGRMLHDIDVQDGLAYLSYWNDGLVILDVGNGIKGGSPENPQLVSQLKYDLNALYRDVEAVGGPGFIRGTHTAWRSGRYVFVGDEVFSAKPVGNARPGRPRTRLRTAARRGCLRPERRRAWSRGTSRRTGARTTSGWPGTRSTSATTRAVSGSWTCRASCAGDLQQQGREIAHVATGDGAGQDPECAAHVGRDLPERPDLRAGHELRALGGEGGRIGGGRAVGGGRGGYICPPCRSPSRSRSAPSAIAPGARPLPFRAGEARRGHGKLTLRGRGRRSRLALIEVGLES